MLKTSWQTKNLINLVLFVEQLVDVEFKTFAFITINKFALLETFIFKVFFFQLPTFDYFLFNIIFVKPFCNLKLQLK